jgi:RND family efflux transporter MFP subunit
MPPHWPLDLRPASRTAGAAGSATSSLRLARCTCTILLAAGLGFSAGCNRHGENDASTSATPPAVRLGTESVARAAMEDIRTGPVISGTLQAATQANVRAEVGGSIVRVTAQEGEAVRKGQVLAEIEARDLRDAVTSADVAVSSAETALKVAQSEAERTRRLVEGGALAQRDLENALTAVANAESQLAAARARAASARAPLGNTILRAPISGVVSARPANTGDVVQPGTALYTIIDPSSMRLEASVPSEEIGGIRIAAPVTFTVRGYGERFTGTIERISPAADPATRQVSIFVSIPNLGGRLIAGLFAEGRVETATRHALVIPGDAVDASGPRPSVTRVRDGKAERVEVGVGLRDPDTERVEITTGLSPGDIVLTGPARNITPGTPVTVGPDTAAGRS